LDVECLGFHILTDLLFAAEQSTGEGCVLYNIQAEEINDTARKLKRILNCLSPNVSVHITGVPAQICTSWAQAEQFLLG
jgi:hypothetical protein